MANNTDNARRQPRRRRSGGVSVSLAIVLIILSLLMGGFAGYAVARKTDPHVHELQETRDRVMELENTLTLIGYPVDDPEADPEQWLYDNNIQENALADLDGSDVWADDEDDVWNDDSLLAGVLPEDGEPVVVAEFDGGELLSTEVIPAYNDMLTTRIFAGHNAEDVAEETLNEVLVQLAGDKVMAARAEALGLTELTDADLERINSQASQLWESQLNDYVAFVDPEADRETAAQRLAEEGGVTLESITGQLKQSWWAQKFYEYLVQDVTVSDEEVQAHYDALLADQKADFSATPEDFEYARTTGKAVVWRPEGYRAVRDILIPFENEADSYKAESLLNDLEMIDEDPDALQKAQAELDALFAPLEKRAEEASRKLAEGASFADLMDEYGCSEALAEEPLRSQGFYITDTSYCNSLEYVQGAMMLEQPGQVSSPLRSRFGLHLVEYIGDVPAGEVPFIEIEAAVRDDALSEKQTAYYAQQRQQLLEEAHVKYYPERLH